MKKFVLFLFIITGISNNPALFSQPLEVEQAIPTCYTHYQKVVDNYYPSRYWDKQSNDNANSWSVFHGGDNQLWMIMPTYPGSTEAMIINVEGEKYLMSV